MRSMTKKTRTKINWDAKQRPTATPDPTRKFVSSTLATLRLDSALSLRLRETRVATEDVAATTEITTEDAKNIVLHRLSIALQLRITCARKRNMKMTNIKHSKKIETIAPTRTNGRLANGPTRRMWRMMVVIVASKATVPSAADNMLESMTDYLGPNMGGQQLRQDSNRKNAN